MRYVIAGASGFLGTALGDRLSAAGHEVVRLVRGPAGSASESTWDPYAGAVDDDLVARADVVVNLAGANLARWPWTAGYRRQIRESRTRTTGTLAEAIARAPDPPAFLAGSAVARYGTDRGDEILTEDSGDGTGFLADVVRAWEEAAAPARHAGARVCFLRSGMVLDRSANALRLMRLPFWFGLGGTVGSGRQYLPMISLADWIEAVRFLAEHPECSGPYNLVSPSPATNAELTRALAAAMHRPAFLRVPAAVLRLALGGIADELVGSRRILPDRLVAAGFRHQHRDVEAIVAAALGR